MFGYVTINREALSDVEFARYHEYYCGLCHQLKAQYGGLSRLTLSNDLTFLLILLSSLYEPEETVLTERCVVHPGKKHACRISRLTEYATDMNLAMTYHKCLDNWADDRNHLSLAESHLLEKAYRQIEARYPEKCAFIADRIRELSEMEKANLLQIDAPTNCTGRLFGEMYCYQNDLWQDTLRSMGEALGRFIYLMDAYDDLRADLRRGRYNPLCAVRERDDYEDYMQRLLTITIADCTAEFEKLPLVQDINVLRNVLYSGIWSKYAQIQKKKEKDKKA